MAYRILLVDDEADILEFIRYNLEKEDYEVFTASNGREAVETALRVVPHLILLDVMMPEMDGIETCREIRSHDSLRRTLIAFLTARGEDYSQIAGFDAGADDYIAKPIHVRVLLSRIRAMLKRFDSTVRDADGQSCGVVIDRERYLVFCEGRPVDASAQGVRAVEPALFETSEGILAGGNFRKRLGQRRDRGRPDDRRAWSANCGRSSETGIS